MRTPLRLALLAGAVLAGVTCTDAPTAPLAPAPSGALARLSLAPSFSREAAEAWQSLAAFNLVANNVHVVLKRPGPPELVLKDTVVTIAPGQTEISIELTVPISGPEEQLGATIQVRDGTQVLFEGTGTVVAVRAGTPGTPPGGGSVGVTLTYVGPGASVRAIRISPRDQVVATGASIAFGVTATDGNGASIAPPPIAWSLSDPTLGTIGTGDGAFTAGTKRGTVIVRAATPSAIIDQVTIGIVPPAQRIVTIAGAGQSASAGKAVAQPFVVEVQAADGLPVPGVAVAFSAGTGASVTPASATTDANGRASATMTVGRTAGSYTFTAAAGTLGSTSVTATATPAPASAIAAVSGSGQGGAVGTAAAQPLVARVSDEFGAPVAGATVAWAIGSGGGTLSAASSVTDAEGKAQVSYSYGTTPGAATVTATVTTPAGSSSASFSLTATPASVAALTIVSGSGQAGAPNAVLLPLVVKATDAQGNPAPNFTITWTTAGGSLSDGVTTTGADGTTSVVLTLGSAAGPVQVTATAPATGGTPGASVTFTATTTAGAPASMAKHAGDAQSATAGTAVPVAPAVKVLDAFGNRVPGAVVTFAVASGGGSITGGSTTTDANGVATVGSWTLGGVPGANTLTATSGTLNATFTATGLAASGPPAQLIALNGPTFSYVAGATVTTWPQVKVVDAASAPVPGAPVSVSVTDPSGAVTSFTVTTNASGVADLHPAGVTSFGGAGSYTGTASIAAATASPFNFTISVAPGALSALVITTLPATSASIGAPLSPQPVVRAVDASGNAIAGVPVTVSIVSGGGAFTTASVTTVTTGTNGEAAFSGLAFASGSGTQSLRFTSGAISSASATVTIFANAPVVGALAVTPAVLVTGATGTWSATIGNGTASAIGNVVVQGWIEQGATRTAAGGMIPTCGTAAAGTLDAGASCPVTFSFTVPAASGLVTGPATFVLELMSGTSVLATAQVPVTVSTTAPPAGTTITWTGAVSSDWHTPANWAENRVPNASDNAWIPQQAPLGLTAAGAMNYGGITLSANAVVGTIRAVSYSIGIDVQDYQLEVTGPALDMGGSSITSSTGLGSVKLSGTNPLLNVYDMPAMTVLHGAHVAEYGEPWVNGNLDILGGTFDVGNGNYLDVDGTLRIEGASAALKMGGSIESGSSVYVYGSFIADGAASDTTLLGGYLNVAGSLRQSATYSARSFAPQPSLYVALEPVGDARVSFATPSDSKFHDLDISLGVSPAPLRAAPAGVAAPLPARVAAM
ncbi:MAG TPA: Ig-like domain-containing protein, partial [Gemmatimonadaceae bacterium]